MIIDKAIKVLEDILHYVEPGDSPEEHRAIELGIEALKRVRDNNLNPQRADFRPLPGETKD